MTTTFKTLTNLIKAADNVVIMAHKAIDLDALGSAVCLARIVDSFKKEYFVAINLNNNNNTIENALALLKTSKININFADLKTIKPKIKKNTLLIILDTSKKDLVEFPELLDKISDKVVLDHHVVGNKDIKETKLSYINSNISSTNEIMTNYLKYLNKTIDPVIATIMLAGIEIDTNSYAVKTSSKTFLAAAFLLELGALNALKQQLLKDSKENYLKQQEYLKNSYILNEKYAICEINDFVKKEDLAIIAEQLLLFEKVEAAFAVGQINDAEVSISARSFGEIDVYEIMKNLGGGGHFTDAASQFKNFNINKVVKLLKAELEEL